MAPGRSTTADQRELSNPEQMPPWQLPANTHCLGFAAKRSTARERSSSSLTTPPSKSKPSSAPMPTPANSSLAHAAASEQRGAHRPPPGQGFELRTDVQCHSVPKQGYLHPSGGDAHLTRWATPPACSIRPCPPKEPDWAIDHQAERSQTAEQEIEQQDNVAGSGQQDELSAPHIVLSAPAGIAVATPKNHPPCQPTAQRPLPCLTSP